MSLTDFIKRRKNIVHQESDGINLAIYLINELRGRTFTFKGLKNIYFGLSGESLIVIAFDHNHVCLLPINLAKSYTIKELIGSIVMLSSIS